MNKIDRKSPLAYRASMLVFLFLAAAASFAEQSGPTKTTGLPVNCDSKIVGSPYIPVDSFVYPAVLRLYSLGYVDTIYLNMRPWTRASLSHILKQTGDLLKNAKAAEETRAIMPAGRDKVLLILGGKPMEAFLDVNQRNKIKEELTQGLKGLFKDGEDIYAVYVTDIIIQ